MRRRLLMAYFGKKLALCLAAGLLAASMVMPAYAASRKKITSISLSIKADIQPDTDYGEESIEIESSSNRYNVDGYEVMNEGFGWTEDTVPEIRITLTANDDYYFTMLGKDKIALKGGAEFKKATRQDSGATLLLDVTLPSMQNSLKDMEGVTLSQEGIASWPAVSTAGSYEVRVYRGDKIVGAALTTDTNSVNCRERMVKPNESYMVKVRAVNKFDTTIKGEWASSNTIYINGDQAAAFRDNLDAAGVEGGSGAAGEWKQTADGRWWFDQGNGSYPADGWMEIGNKWYFFDAEGYMKTGWIHWNEKDYYCSENGDMLTSCMTPDNYLVGEDGARIAQ